MQLSLKDELPVISLKKPRRAPLRPLRRAHLRTERVCPTMERRGQLAGSSRQQAVGRRPMQDYRVQPVLRATTAPFS